MEQQAVIAAARRPNSDDDVVIWSALTPAECSKGVRWFAARPSKEQAQILATSQEKILPRLQSKNADRHADAHMRFAALLLAIRESGFDLIRKRGYRIAGDKQFEQFDQLRASTVMCIRERRKAPLRKQVLAYWGDVCTLKGKTNDDVLGLSPVLAYWGDVCTLKRNENAGFLLISRFLLQVHKIKISPQYLAKLWKELEGVSNGISRN